MPVSKGANNGSFASARRDVHQRRRAAPELFCHSAFGEKEQQLSLRQLGGATVSPFWETSLRKPLSQSEPSVIAVSRYVSINIVLAERAIHFK